MRLIFCLAFIYVFGGCSVARNEQSIGFELKLEPAGLPIGGISFNAKNKQDFGAIGLIEKESDLIEVEPKISSQVTKPPSQKNKKTGSSVNLLMTLILSVAGIFGIKNRMKWLVNLF